MGRALRSNIHIHKVLEYTLETFHFPETVQVLLNPTPITQNSINHSHQPSHSGILAKAIKQCIQLSTTNAIYISHFVIEMSAFQKQSPWSCSVKELFLKILQNSQVLPLAQEFPVDFTTS